MWQHTRLSGWRMCVFLVLTIFFLTRLANGGKLQYRRFDRVNLKSTDTSSTQVLQCYVGSMGVALPFPLYLVSTVECQERKPVNTASILTNILLEYA